MALMYFKKLQKQKEQKEKERQIILNNDMLELDTELINFVTLRKDMLLLYSNRKHSPNSFRYIVYVRGIYFTEKKSFDYNCDHIFTFEFNIKVDCWPPTYKRVTEETIIHMRNNLKRLYKAVNEMLWRYELDCPSTKVTEIGGLTFHSELLYNCYSTNSKKTVPPLILATACSKRSISVSMALFDIADNDRDINSFDFRSGRAESRLQPIGHVRCKEAALTIILANRISNVNVFNCFPKDIIKLIAKAVYNTRNDVRWKKKS